MAVAVEGPIFVPNVTMNSVADTARPSDISTPPSNSSHFPELGRKWGSPIANALQAEKGQAGKVSYIHILHLKATIGGRGDSDIEPNRKSDRKVGVLLLCSNDSHNRSRYGAIGHT